ncbi:MAG: 1-deoxy-D-xylulose-5-phosphate reductoisomerase [Cellvibrionales bacterium]|nr:MAG: 1-deoxy-D-xylulose-5-phosphate reductoisomerase [Cellvibrionales bacterium]
MQQLSILGSTGSIGVSTLDVVARHPDRYQVFALTGHTRTKELATQCQQFKPRYVVISSAESVQLLKSLVPPETQVLSGGDGLAFVAGHDQVDVVMAAIVGAAGLMPTLAAVRAGKKVLLANKEALVMAGGLFMEAVRDHGATLLPIDSEHNAIFQCLPESFKCGGERADDGIETPGARSEADDSRARLPGVKRLLLSGSGGPFRTTPIESLASVTPDQACAHPNWQMGRKISVDSATMMNKGLELIEACWLFGVDETQVEIIIHPQSIVHSLVEYADGSVLAQLGNPDMRTPIAHALAWPERIESGVAMLDLAASGVLNFEPPDLQRFPSLKLARVAARERGDAPAALNAANEVAVEAFLAERIAFTHIAQIVDSVMQTWSSTEPECLSAVQEADTRARALAREKLTGL